MPLKPELPRFVAVKASFEPQQVHCPHCEKTWYSPNASASLYAHTAWAHSIELEGHAHV